MVQKLRQASGLCLIEFAVMGALMIGVMLPALAMIADNILDILNDLAEDLDVIDDLVADIDLEGMMPESNEDNDSNDDGGGSGGGSGSGGYCGCI